MTVEAAIEPAATPSIRPTATRVLLVTAVYVVAVVAAGIYPLVSPLRYAGPITVEGQLMSVCERRGLAGRAPDRAGSPARGPALEVDLRVVAGEPDLRLQYVPNSLVWSVARPLEILAIAAYVHLAIAYPTGYLRSRFDRGVVLYVYALLVGQALLAHPFWEVTVGCVPDCVRNVFVVWPNEQIYSSSPTGMVVGVVTGVPLILIALWRHWRDASPAGGEPCCRSSSPSPSRRPSPPTDALVRAVGFQPGIAFFDGPSGDGAAAGRPDDPAGRPVDHLPASAPEPGSGREPRRRARPRRAARRPSRRPRAGTRRPEPAAGLRRAVGSGYVDASGQPLDLPVDDSTRTVTRLERDDELLGVLVHDPAIDAEDPGLVEAVGNAARLALENERLAAEVRAQLEEVRASRARIVEAADAERRRVERDLHDGAQQRLVALAMRLQVAKSTTPDAAALLDEATGELETAIGEVRGLARGVHPTILTEAGLRAAVDALAERTPMPVAVDVLDGASTPRSRRRPTLSSPRR